MNQNCNEQFLNDIIKVELVLASACAFSIPFSIPGISTIGGTVGSASLKIAASAQEGDDGEYEQQPVLKQQDKREAAGTLVQHSVQVAVTAGHADVRSKVAALQYKDFNVVLTTQDGLRYLIYSLPATSQVMIEEQGVDDTLTLKITSQSLNHIIRITE
jgi:hypothetical protein